MPTTGSLYFHIPFCTKKCDYCHFYVLPDKPELHKLLAEGLDRELQLWGHEISKFSLESIYFGGGTPFLFGPAAIEHVLNEVSKYTSIGDIEITLEANPEHITRDAMRDFAAAGINRISLGVQSLDDMLLKKLSRSHSSDEAVKAVMDTFHSGIRNISIDLMYDIPGQTIDAWKKTLEKVEGLPVTHLSLYNLTIEPHTVFFKYRDRIEKEMPGVDASTAMYLDAIDGLTKMGFEQYEISAFCKDDKYSRHNVGYWTGRQFLGIGPSAFSYWQGKRFRNVANIHKYMEKLRNGELATDFSEELDENKRQRELIAIGLRMTKGVRVPENVSSDLLKSLQTLQQQGLLIIQDGTAALTDRGRLLHDSVAEIII